MVVPKFLSIRLKCLVAGLFYKHHKLFLFSSKLQSLPLFHNIATLLSYAFSTWYHMCATWYTGSISSYTVYYKLIFTHQAFVNHNVIADESYAYFKQITQVSIESWYSLWMYIRKFAYTVVLSTKTWHAKFGISYCIEVTYVKTN